ncbi:transposable element Tcb2 transposase [Trichonephila clavipes]|nr:transposable element Tcb2 transposase [Trichonephila clavipes]
MRGTLTGQRYVDDVLRPHVGPFLNGLPEAIFQQDNARPHTARVAQDFLRHFQTLPWPTRFPDLSPVEHVWDQLKRQMPSCHSVHDFELVVEDLWAHLPQDNIRCLINSMPNRVAACIAAGAASPLVRLVEEQQRWEAPDHPQSVLPQNWGGNEPNCAVAVTCMVLKATANDRRHLALFHDELRGP